MAGFAVLMAVWWITEAVPIPVTALIPLIVFPLVGIGTIKATATPYANPLVYLFLGGFILALAIERCGLHKRIALSVLEWMGGGDRLVAGFMLTASLLSMWITNTATTMLLLPIAISVLTVITDNNPSLSVKDKRKLSAALLLGLAYAATIGGMVTLIGTVPNTLLAAFMNQNYEYEVSFLKWMAVGLPVALCLLPLTWWVLTRVVFPVRLNTTPEALDEIHRRRMELKAMSRAEKLVTGIFILTAGAWLTRPLLQKIPLLENLSDPAIALSAAVILFLLPGDKNGERLIDWHATSKLPWGLLLLFGGGLSLAAAISGTGLATWLGEHLSSVGTLHPVVIVAIVTALIVFLTEVTSNTATTASFLPVVAALALQTGHDVLLLLLPVALAASCAFMLPVATPPNAIIYGSERVGINQMVRAGLILNFVSIIIVTLMTSLLVPIVFD